MAYIKPYSHIFYILSNRGFIPLVESEAKSFIASWKEANPEYRTVNLSHGRAWDKTILISKDGSSIIFPYGYTIGEIMPKINAALKKAA